jgi:hypothetical protein
LERGIYAASTQGWLERLRECQRIEKGIVMLKRDGDAE